MIPEKNEVVVEKIYEVKEPMPESTPEIVKEVIITKVEPEVEKVSMKPKHPKKEEKKEIVEVKEETIAPKEELPSLRLLSQVEMEFLFSFFVVLSSSTPCFFSSSFSFCIAFA